MIKHTPGPFEVYVPHGIGARDGKGNRIHLAAVSPFPVAPAGPSDLGHGHYNALLFAQAPALADALAAFVEQHVDDGICGPKSSAKAEGAPEWCQWCEPARETLRAAGRLP